eukprot:GHVU01054133.1.p1 GENE.GHVU01054133.1~~GHVU01054133.1.p1  ORF type:complete len:293 (-),score=23.73 GHVU01054133.1:397-1275(-)
MFHCHIFVDSLCSRFIRISAAFFCVCVGNVTMRIRGVTPGFNTDSGPDLLYLELHRELMEFKVQEYFGSRARVERRADTCMFLPEDQSDPDHFPVPTEEELSSYFRSVKLPIFRDGASTDLAARLALVCQEIPKIKSAKLKIVESPTMVRVVVSDDSWGWLYRGFWKIIFELMTRFSGPDGRGAELLFSFGGANEVPRWRLHGALGSRLRRISKGQVAFCMGILTTTTRDVSVLTGEPGELAFHSQLVLEEYFSNTRPRRHGDMMEMCIPIRNASFAEDAPLEILLDSGNRG